MTARNGGDRQLSVRANGGIMSEDHRDRTKDLVEHCARLLIRDFLADPFRFPQEKELHTRFERTFAVEQGKAELNLG